MRLCNGVDWPLRAVLVANAPRAYAVDDGLPFTAEHLPAVGGNAEKLNGTAALAVDKTADAGKSKLLLRSKKSYANFRLTYRFCTMAAVGDPMCYSHIRIQPVTIGKLNFFDNDLFL